MKRYLYIALLVFCVSMMQLGSIIAQPKMTWHPTSGPVGGMVNDIATDSSGNVWLVTGRAGCYMSADHANSWQAVNWNLPRTNLLRICPGKNGMIFAVSIDKKQLYRLNTLTARPQWSWENVPIDTNGAPINDIATTTTDGEVIIAYGGVGMLRSTDNGSTWKMFGDSLKKATALRVAHGSGGEYCLVAIGAGPSIPTVSHVYFTTNSGTSWSTYPKPLPGLSTMTGVVFNANHRILVSTAANDTRIPQFGGRIYYGADTGWVVVFERPYTSEDGKNGVDKIVKVLPSATLYANVHGPTIRSVDGGLTWTPKDTNKRGDEPFSMTSSADEQYLYESGEPDGVFGSTDLGLTWTEKNNGILAHFEYGLAINSKQHLFAITEFSLNRSTDNGAHWDYSTEYGETYFPSIFIAKNDNIFIGYTLGLLRSTDNGESFKTVIGVDTLNVARTNIVLVTRESGSGKLFSASVSQNFGLQISTDNGTTWKRDPTLSNTVQPQSIGCSHDTIFLSTNTNDIYRSINNGASWQAIPTIYTGIQEIIVHTDGSILAMLGSANGGIIRSVDGGNSWSKIFPPTDAKPATDYFGMTNDDEGTIFVYTDSGVFRSDKTYAIWTNISDGLTPGNYDPKKYINVAEIVQNTKNRKYYAAVRGLSVYESVPELDVVAKQQNLPSSASTLENYPNPFATTTMINFRLDEASSVELDIYNVGGRRVGKILSATLDAGEHTIPFQSGNLPSGNYMVVLRAGASTQTSWITITK